MDHHKQGFLLVVAGLVGAVGVAAAAGSSHMAESRNLAGIAAICLSHGPALLALGLFANSRMLLIAGWVLAAGTLVFVGDLGLREWVGSGLFPGAAPLGGGGMLLGWACVAVAGFFVPDRKKFNKD